MSCNHSGSQNHCANMPLGSQVQPIPQEGPGRPRIVLILQPSGLERLFAIGRRWRNRTPAFRIGAGVAECRFRILRYLLGVVPRAGQRYLPNLTYGFRPSALDPEPMTGVEPVTSCIPSKRSTI